MSATRLKDPPSTLREAFRFLGPGLVLSASIVGSGELIATTILGARAGFVTLWVILVSCLVKVTLQLEFGKHAIHTGEPTMLSLNKLPGPRIGAANWTIWTWLFLMLFKTLQGGGIIGGAALIMALALPGLSVTAWCFVIAIVVSLCVFHGYYAIIEKSTLVMIALFTVLTLVSVAALQYTPYAVSTAEILSGLHFALPPEAVVIAIGAFAITGVGGDEIMAYNYWLLEKGYAAYVGPKSESPAWAARARGWIRVMYLDAFCAMLVYTTVTAAFYVLGAAVLHRNAMVPQKTELIVVLSTMYTETLGPWANGVFLLGAFLVLFSTLFASLAASTRIFSDAFSRLGWFDFTDNLARARSITVLAWALPPLWAVLFWKFQAPGLMVIVGGLATMLILLIVVFAALIFRYQRLDSRLQPSWFYDTALWMSCVSIGCIAVYGVVQKLR